MAGQWGAVSPGADPSNTKSIFTHHVAPGTNPSWSIDVWPWKILCGIYQVDFTAAGFPAV